MSPATAPVPLAQLTGCQRGMDLLPNILEKPFARSSNTLMSNQILRIHRNEKGIMDWTMDTLMDSDVLPDPACAGRL